MAKLSSLPKPLVYKEEVHFVNFSALASAGDSDSNPTYFGVLRDPLARFKSRFQFVRASRYLLRSS